VKTDDLIEQLTQDARPVRRVHGPWIRTGLWLLVSLPYVAVIVFWYWPAGAAFNGPIDTRFLVAEFAALLTAATAAAAAFASVVPGYDRRVLLLPVLPLAFWLGSVGFGCLSDWLRFGPEGLALRPDWDCLPPGILLGIVPVGAILVMLRRGAPLSPRITVALAALAAAALGNAGLSLFHARDASIMILVWHLGTAAVLAGVAGLVGRRVLSWRRTVAHSMRAA
jgi:hypothetical protein